MTLIVDVSVPVIEGVNVTEIEQVAPTATVAQVVPVSVKSAPSGPRNEILPTVTGLLVRFARVTTKGWLVTPTNCLPKFSVDGLSMTPVAKPGVNRATKAAPVLNVV